MYRIMKPGTDASKSPNVREHFDRMMARRGAAVAFDRFEAASTECDGNRLHLDVLDVKSTLATVVFVPGTAVYGLVFGDFLAGLADRGLNVVSVDPRGHGRSEGQHGSYTLPELVRDVRAAVAYARDRFGRPVFVAGSSQGGIVAFYVAATDEKLAGAVCHNIADLGHPDRFRMTAHPQVARAAGPVVRAAARLFPELGIDIQKYFGLLSSGDSDVKERLAADPLALKRITLRALASLSSAPMPRPPEQITTPVLVLHGRDDRIFPLHYVEGLYARLTCEKAIRVYEGRDHFIFTDRPGPALDDIVGWIRVSAGQDPREFADTATGVRKSRIASTA